MFGMETKEVVIGGVAVAGFGLGVFNTIKGAITSKKLKGLETYVGAHTIVATAPAAAQPAAEAVQAKVVQ